MLPFYVCIHVSQLSVMIDCRLHHHITEVNQAILNNEVDIYPFFPASILPSFYLC